MRDECWDKLDELRRAFAWCMLALIASVLFICAFGALMKYLVG